MPGAVAVMSEDHQLISEIDRARQAQELAEHPIFKEALEQYRQRLNDEWAASPARDTEGRERLWLMQKTVGVVQQHLKELMETGKLASIQWEQKLTLAQRAKAALRGQW